MRSMSTAEIQLGFKAAELDRLATQQWGSRQAGLGLENSRSKIPSRTSDHGGETGMIS
jgi:hypothetical protein